MNTPQFNETLTPNKCPMSVKIRAWELIDEGCDILAAMLSATREWLEQQDNKKQSDKNV